MWHPGIASNMNFPATIAVLGFLMAIAGLVLSALAVITFLLVGKAKWARRVGALVGVGAVVYFGLLFGMSLASKEDTLARGQEKYFCEMDCHLAYSVVASREELVGGQRATACNRAYPLSREHHLTAAAQGCTADAQSAARGTDRQPGTRLRSDCNGRNSTHAQPDPRRSL